LVVCNGVDLLVPCKSGDRTRLTTLGRMLSWTYRCKNNKILKDINLNETIKVAWLWPEYLSAGKLYEPAVHIWHHCSVGWTMLKFIHHNNLPGPSSVGEVSPRTWEGQEHAGFEKHSYI
jgi:hypothetical protein